MAATKIANTRLVPRTYLDDDQNVPDEEQGKMVEIEHKNLMTKRSVNFEKPPLSKDLFVESKSIVCSFYFLILVGIGKLAPEL